MNILMRNLYESALKNKPSLNILVFPYDGLFEYMLAQAFPQHNFILHQPSIIYKDWIKSASILPNISITNNISLNNHINIIIINNKFQQWDIATNISNTYHIPIIYYEHLPCHGVMRAEDVHLTNIQKHTQFTINVSQRVAEEWKNNGEIIPYGLKFDDCIKTNTIITNLNLQQITHEIKEHLRLPLNNFNPEIPFDTQIQPHKYFLYFVQAPYDNLPIYIAMSKNCNVVSNIIGENIHTINPIELNQLSLQNIGFNNKQYIETAFNENKFIKNWTQLFNKASTMVYTR